MSRPLSELSERELKTLAEGISSEIDRREAPERRRQERAAQAAREDNLRALRDLRRPLYESRLYHVCGRCGEPGLDFAPDAYGGGHARCAHCGAHHSRG
jgi:ribosomal protein S14